MEIRTLVAAARVRPQAGFAAIAMLGAAGPWLDLSDAQLPVEHAHLAGNVEEERRKEHRFHPYASRGWCDRAGCRYPAAEAALVGAARDSLRARGCPEDRINWYLSPSRQHLLGDLVQRATAALRA